MITSDEVTESYNEKIKTIPTSFDKKYMICKTQSFYILLVFLLIIIALLIAVSVYCYLVRYQRKQKHLSPFHDAKSKQSFLINKKDFDLKNIKINDKSYKDILIYYIGYVTIKDSQNT